MAKIEIYSTQNCSFCTQAKKLFTNKQELFTEILVDNSVANFKLMLERSNGQRTMPQIFINDAHVGGFTDVARLNSSGELDDLLQKHGN